VAYCDVTDLLTGNIPTPASLDPAKFVSDAADEMDSIIGRIYHTPVDISPSGTVSRPSRLALKRINVHLATGRLLLAADAAGEQQKLHEYAIYLVKSAQEALNAIVTGQVVLDGAIVEEGDGTLNVTTPLINNIDDVSNVEAFYDFFKPDFLVTEPSAYGWH
jgi:hypothetical protein